MKREKSEMGDRNGRLLLDRQEIDAGRAHKKPETSVVSRDYVDWKQMG